MIVKTVPIMDVHPSWLGGLIAIDTPCFQDENGEAKNCRFVALNEEDHKVIFNDISVDAITHTRGLECHLPLVTRSINAAKAAGFKYILSINVLEEQTQTQNEITKKYMIGVRGA